MFILYKSYKVFAIVTSTRECFVRGYTKYHYLLTNDRAWQWYFTYFCRFLAKIYILCAICFAFYYNRACLGVLSNCGNKTWDAMQVGFWSWSMFYITFLAQTSLNSGVQTCYVYHVLSINRWSKQAYVPFCGGGIILFC